MKEVSLEKLKRQIPERRFEEGYSKSGHLQIAYSAGNAKALWNLLIACVDAEVDNFETMYRIAEESKDLAHLCGFHKWRWRKSKFHEMRLFLSMIWYSTHLLTAKVGLRDYIEFVCENSRTGKMGTTDRPFGLLDAAIFAPEDQPDDFNPRLPWRTREWLRALARHKRSLVPRVIWEPLTEFYPYIAKSPTEEHELLLAIDRAVGQRLPSEWRGDFCQDLIVSILSGELSAANVSDEIPNYLKKFKKEMPNKYKEISIDALIFSESGGRTFGDTLMAKPDEDLTDEEAHLRPLTSRYGQSLTDCETTEEFAERLQGAWDANRLTEEQKTYTRFEKPDGTAYADPDYYRYRRKYQLVNGHVKTQEVEPERFGGAWSPESALPEERRDEVV